ncbi:MAG: DUF790 family protein [Bradymonadaceae bacterium]|nr:DUF790 family protein [Lujinxingiaceae bacterium]
MLTSDLVRARVKKGRVEPYYLDVTQPAAIARAAELIAIFEAGVLLERQVIVESVEEVIGHGTDFLIWRGLAKLLDDRSEFETAAPCDPADIRRVVFTLAAARGALEDAQIRAEVLELAAAELGIAPEQCEAGLYADLEARQRLVKFKTLSADKLLARYNLALAQAILYRASSLVMSIEDVDSNKLRYLFSALKFHRLMHSARRTEGGYEVIIDGPASLFSQSRKYGLQMAKFLPALVNIPRWSLRAELQEDAKNKGSEFVLSSKDGLLSHYKMKGQWVAKEERWFEERFAKLESDWRLERRGTILDLDDNEVIVADYVLIAPDGGEVYVEIVGFWRLAYLERRIARLAALRDKALVLVVSERLKADRQKLIEAPAEVVFFKGVILADRVLEAAKKAAAQTIAR